LGDPLAPLPPPRRTALYLYFSSSHETSTIKLPPCRTSAISTAGAPFGLRRLNSVSGCGQAPATYYTVQPSRRGSENVSRVREPTPLHKPNTRVHKTTVLFIATATTCGLTRAAAVRRANPPPTILQPPGQAVERRAHRCRPTRVGESIIRISRKSIHPERQDKARRAWCARDTEIQSTDKK